MVLITHEHMSTGQAEQSRLSPGLSAEQFSGALTYEFILFKLSVTQITRTSNQFSQLKRIGMSLIPKTHRLLFE